MTLPPLVEGWMPPTRENYERILHVWQFLFLIMGSCQWLIGWYGMGKTSVASRFNVPGRVGWMIMETPGFVILLYIMNSLPRMQGIEDLPWQNKVLAGLFVMHYIYRAVIFPLMAPSMSPLHVLVGVMAVVFQLFNGTCLGSWLAAYGHTTREEWGSTLRFAGGILIFYIGLSANFFHDEELREIRRREMRRQEKIGREAGGRNRHMKIDKHYRIPEAGLFRHILYPHYLCEWIEWTGFWLACGVGCLPAMMFVANEVATMMPRAVRGKWWYGDKFGEEKIRKKWAVLPGVC